MTTYGAGDQGVGNSEVSEAERSMETLKVAIKDLESNPSDSLTSYNESVPELQFAARSETNKMTNNIGNNKFKSEEQLNSKEHHGDQHKQPDQERNQYNYFHHHQQQQQQHAHSIIRPSKKRFFILLMFVVLHLIKSFQWICLASITNVVAKFYDVDNLAINWTTILFMVTFLVLAVPVSWIMDSMGLRRSVLIGSIGVTIGLIIKCFSCTRDGFAVGMIGHLIIGLSEPFFFNSYSQIASLWFPDHQVALATAASLVGEEAGLALGFIIPPLMVGNDPNDFDSIQDGLSRLFHVVALLCFVNTCSIVVFFEDKPKFAPGIARHKQIQDEIQRRQSTILPAVPINNDCGKKLTFRSASSNALGESRGRRFSRRISQNLGEQVKLSAKFFTSKHFILLFTGFGINLGVAYSLHTLLNQMIVRPPLDASPTITGSDLVLDQMAEGDSRQDIAGLGAAIGILEQDVNTSTTMSAGPSTISRWSAEDTNLIVGNAGLILILAGLVGSGLCGFVLDKYHKYKLTTASIYLIGLLSMAALTVCLLLENELLLYLVIVPLGFSLTGYATCGFDYGVEITYPKPELLSSTFLNMSAQIFGIPISLAGSIIVDKYGSQALGAFFCAILLVGFMITLLQGGELRRQDAVIQGGLLKQQQEKQAEQLKRAQQHQIWST